MKKKILTILLSTIFAIGLIGCNVEESSTQKEKRETEEAMQQMADEVGMPYITNYYEKKMAKKIFELRDDSNLICYAYTKNEMSGKYTYLGRCMGYGIPYSVQYTNPDKLSKDYYDASVISQADPNGLYMPDGLSATWLIMINEESGEQEPMYVEPEIMVSQTKLPKRLLDESTLPSYY